MRLITWCSKKALSRRNSESRPCAEGCGNARHNRRRNATSNAIALEVAPWPAVTQKQRAAMQALQSKHTHSKQQSKRYKASGPATAARSETCAPSSAQETYERDRSSWVERARLAPPQDFKGHPSHRPRRHSPRPSSDDLAQPPRHHGVVCSY